MQAVGYKVAVENVYVGNSPTDIFETWFVKDTIDFTQTDYESWKNNYKGFNIL